MMTIADSDECTSKREGHSSQSSHIPPCGIAALSSSVSFTKRSKYVQCPVAIGYSVRAFSNIVTNARSSRTFDTLTKYARCGGSPDKNYTGGNSSDERSSDSGSAISH
ncbi:hypothetical protein [Solimicrobium silvestre]|uniref:hypothetical protein n=1 Tax=Solimicrobium silvestre TaxID=2099400 RepID=UPI0010570E97|nr:hypothetical protein [Solimicrobium silvestre]